MLFPQSETGFGAAQRRHSERLRECETEVRAHTLRYASIYILIFEIMMKLFRICTDIGRIVGIDYLSMGVEKSRSHLARFLGESRLKKSRSLYYRVVIYEPRCPALASSFIIRF